MDDRLATTSDDILISMIRNGSTTAVTELVMRYIPLIRRKAASYRLPGMEPEDIVQEGLLGLIKAISRYQPGKSSFSTFAWLCVSSSLATAAKSALSPKSLPLSNYAPLGELSTLDIQRQPSERTELLGSIYSRLSPLEQQVLKLYLSGHSYTETAHRLSTTPKAVDNALQRVRRKLRAAL